MPKVSAIEQMPDSAKQIIYQEKADDATFTEIQSKLNDIYNEDLTYEQVQGWWNNHSDDIRADITEDNLGHLKQEKMKEIIDSASQLDKIHDKLNEAIDTLDPTQRNDMGMLKELLSESRKQLKFQQKLIDNLTESTEINNVEEMNVQQNYNAVEINQEFNEYIRELEEDDVISIEKPEKLKV